jgi:hypothetical protein
LGQRLRSRSRVSLSRRSVSLGRSRVSLSGRSLSLSSRRFGCRFGCRRVVLAAVTACEGN